MSNRNYSNIGDYKLIVDGGKVVVQGQLGLQTPLEINQRDNTPASIGFTFSGATPGYVGVNNGSFRFGNDTTIPFEVFHQNRLPRLLDEVDTTGVDDFLGAKTDNVLYVSEDGIDANSGETLNFSKRTIKSALDKANQLQAAALSAGKPRPPITIFVKSGRHTENNPMIVNRNVTLWGDNLRSTFVSPRTKPFQTKANFSALEAIDPDPLVANPGSFAGASAALLSAKSTLQADVVTYVNTLPGPPVSDKCGRDVGFIVDAIAEDLIEGGNAKTEKAALAYFRHGDIVLDQDKVTQIVAALQYLADEIQDVLSAFTGSGQEVAVALALAVKDTIENPIDFVKRAAITATIINGSISSVTVDDGGFGYREDPKPSALFAAIANSGTFVEAPELIRLNRAFIQAEVGAFVEANFPSLLTPEQLALCKRDTGFIVDGLVLDLLTSQRPLIESQNQTSYADRFAGGDDYEPGDVITLNNGDIVTVDDVSGGVSGPIIEFTITKAIGLSVVAVQLTQRTVVNSIGTGFTLTPAVSNLVAGTQNSQEVALTYFNNALSILPTPQVAPTQAAISHIGELSKLIIRQQLVSVTNTDGVTQVRSSVLITTDPVAVDTVLDGLVAGINDTIENPVFPSTLLVVDILREIPGVTGNTPAVIEFDVVNNSLTNPTIVDGGSDLLADNGTPSGTRDISLELPQPDDGYDLFYVNNGSYMSGMTFNNLSGKASAVANDPLRRDPLTAPEVKGFTTTSPYVQNCSCINVNEEGGIGMKIDGKHTSGLRSMVSDAFTQINTAGTGVYLLNRGYAQLVSIFTVSTNIGILAESGGFCSVANSNSSFGNFGLVSRGVSELLDSGTVDGDGAPISVFETVIKVDNLIRRPAFGDAVLFNYTYPGTVVGDSVSFTGLEITSADDTRIEIFNDGDLLKQYQYEIVSRAPLTVELTEKQLDVTQDQDDYDASPGNGTFDGGSGYANGDVITLNNGDTVTVDLVSAGVVVEFSVTSINGVAFAGTTLTQDSVAPLGGSGFSLTPEANNLESVITLGTVTSRLRKYYTVDNSTDLDSGTATITLDLGVTQEIPDGTAIEFYQRSLITSSAHTFEYIGSGTNFLEAIPGAGGIPIRENEIVQDDDLGGQVFFTSTDEKGDFKIGPELTINRNTGTITGEAFDRSLFAVLTPYILSLES